MVQSSSSRMVRESDFNTKMDTKADKSALKTVATTGSYLDLDNKPTIPTSLTTLGKVPEKHLAPYRGVFSDKPIVTLRFDDTVIKDVAMANALTNLGLVGSFATVKDNIGRNANYATLSDLLNAQANGHELTAHSRTHLPISTDTAFFDSVVTATEEMRALNLHMQTYTEPGTGGPAQYVLDSMDKLSNSYYGQLMTANFAASQGYISDGPGGGVRERPAPIKHGVSHTTWENAGNEAQRFVERIINGDGAGEILTHLVNIDQASKITTQNYLDFLTWLAAQVAAGRCYVMTPTAAIHAQRGPRVNLFVDGSFDIRGNTPDNQYSNWQYSAGLAGVLGRTGKLALRLPAGATVGQLLPNGELLRTLEAGAWFKADSAGTVLLRVDTYSDKTGTTLLRSTTRQVSIPAGAWTRATMNAGTAPDVRAVRVTYQAVAGGPEFLIDDATLYRN